VTRANGSLKILCKYSGGISSRQSTGLPVKNGICASENFTEMLGPGLIAADGSGTRPSPSGTWGTWLVNLSHPASEAV